MFNKILIPIVLVLGLTLSACDTTVFGGKDEFKSFAQSPVTGVVDSEEDKITRERARATFRQGAVNALAIANDFGDEIAAECYQGIIDYIDSKPEVRVVEDMHALVVLQRTRLGLDRLNNKVPEEIVKACGALYVDMRIDIDDLNKFFGIPLLVR